MRTVANAFSRPLGLDREQHPTADKQIHVHNVQGTRMTQPQCYGTRAAITRYLSGACDQILLLRLCKRFQRRFNALYRPPAQIVDCPRAGILLLSDVNSRAHLHMHGSCEGALTLQKSATKRVKSLKRMLGVRRLNAMEQGSKEERTHQFSNDLPVQAPSAR